MSVCSQITIFRTKGKVDPKQLEFRLKQSGEASWSSMALGGKNLELGSAKLDVAQFCEVLEQNKEHGVQLEIGSFVVVLRLQAMLANKLGPASGPSRGVSETGDIVEDGDNGSGAWDRVSVCFACFVSLFFK